MEVVHCPLSCHVFELRHLSLSDSTLLMVLCIPWYIIRTSSTHLLVLVHEERYIIDTTFSLGRFRNTTRGVALGQTVTTGIKPIISLKTTNGLCSLTLSCIKMVFTLLSDLAESAKRGWVTAYAYGLIYYGCEYAPSQVHFLSPCSLLIIRRLVSIGRSSFRCWSFHGFERILWQFHLVISSSVRLEMNVEFIGKQ